MDVSRHDDYVKKKRKRENIIALTWETKQVFSQVENSDINLKILPYFERFTHPQIQLCKYGFINLLTFFLTQLEVIYP